MAFSTVGPDSIQNIRQDDLFKFKENCSNYMEILSNGKIYIVTIIFTTRDFYHSIIIGVPTITN